MTERKNILLTSIGGELSYQLIELLKRSSAYEFFVIGVDASPNVVARHICDVFKAVSRGQAETYAEEIFSLCQLYDVDMVFPCSDEEAIALSKNRQKFAGIDTIIASNELEKLDIINNKANTYKEMEALGILTPLWYQTQSKSEISEFVNEVLALRGSAVLKLPDGRGSRGIYVIDEAINGRYAYNNTREIHCSPTVFWDEIFPTVDPSFNFIVMEKLYEPTCDLDILAWEGEIIHAVSRRRLNPARPNDGHILEKFDCVIEAAEIFIRQLQLSWIFDIDFMFNQNGEPVFLEVNPRASGSVAVPIAAGVPLIDDLFSLASGKVVQKINYPYGKLVYPVSSLRVALNGSL